MRSCSSSTRRGKLVPRIGPAPTLPVTPHLPSLSFPSPPYAVFVLLWPPPPPRPLDLSPVCYPSSPRLAPRLAPRLPSTRSFSARSSVRSGSLKWGRTSTSVCSGRWSRRSGPQSSTDARPPRLVVQRVVWAAWVPWVGWKQRTPQQDRRWTKSRRRRRRRRRPNLRRRDHHGRRRCKMRRPPLRPPLKVPPPRHLPPLRHRRRRPLDGRPSRANQRTSGGSSHGRGRSLERPVAAWRD